MLARCVTIVILLAQARFAAAGDDTSATDSERLFVLKVKPLLADKCLACHGGDRKEIKASLDLTTRAGMLKGGEASNQVLVPGDATKSVLFRAVTWSDPDLQMPPKENDRLSEVQTWLIRDWINAGAPWPDDARSAAIVAEDKSRNERGVTVQTSGGLSKEWTNRRYQSENLWAYQPIRKQSALSSRQRVSATELNNPIDAFINDRLQSLGLRPAPQTDRRTLLRRATFDLLGLPPTPDEVAAFLADPADDSIAFAKVIDRLLASPHYGEQYARHWLDVVRYADSSGFANDYERGNSWRYRDYVVRAFNSDKPYDQFVREQLAGDEIDEAIPENLIAVGFLRAGPWELTGMEVPKVARQRFLDDVTDSVGQVFLAHALQCCRCHDHKFDPVPTRDYYRIQAAFATTQFAERPAPFLPEENRSGFDQARYLMERRDAYQEILRRLDEKSIAAARDWLAERKLRPAAFHRAIDADAGNRKPAQRAGVGNRYDAARRLLAQQGIPEDQIPPRHLGFTTEDYGQERIARKGLERLRWELDRYQPYAFSVYSGATPELRSVNAPLRRPADPTVGEMEQTSILAGGDPFSPVAPVEPGTLSAVGAMAGTKQALPTTVSGRRRALAEWIANPANPLTPRAMVNRIWLWHFGTALAGNPNNFGATGKKPTHPELLDWLAATFIESGWSVKQMHRAIMMSRAYQRVSEHPDWEQCDKLDPEQTSYAAFRPRRLSAEEIVDSMLAVSGEWNPQVGGIPARPEIHLEVALQPRQVMGTFAEAWQPDPKPKQRHRRAIYHLRLRGISNPLLEVFNQPAPEKSCELRDSSSVTPQVFGLLNSQYVSDRALALAARLRRETPDPATTVDRAFALLYSRDPSNEERAACLTHWLSMSDRHRQIVAQRQAYPHEVIREAVEENTGERFRFVERLNVYRDFIPDLKPSDVDAETRGLADVCLVLLNANEFVFVD